MNKKPLKTWMKSKNACAEATKWVEDKSAMTAWSECTRGDWMLLALGRTSIDKREVVRIACDIALSVMPLSDDPRVAAAIDSAEGWCEGSITAKQCQNAAREARAAADAATAAYAANAAYTADAAYTAAYAADAAADAAYAADAAADAAYTAADTADAFQQARVDTQFEIADLIRSRISAEMFSELVSE